MIVHPSHRRRARLAAACCAALAALTLAAGSFACPALQIDQETSARVPTYAYEFNDDTAPPIFSGPIIPPPVATHAPAPRAAPAPPGVRCAADDARLAVMARPLA